MNKVFTVLLFAVLSIAFVHYDLSDFFRKSAPAELPTIQKKLIPASSSAFKKNGKFKNAVALEDTYTTTPLDIFDLPMIDDKMIDALENQLKLLRYKKKSKKQIDTPLNADIDRLEQTINLLLKHQYSTPEELAKVLDAHQINGKDGKGNVHFTGYFTPIIKVSKTPNAHYQYPIYGRPKGWNGPLPTRKEIEGDGVLNDMGLELAYAANIVDIYFMQVQGSGIVEYQDGSQALYAHNGSNGRSYRSIGKYMIEAGYATKANVSLKSIDKFFQRNPDLIEEIMFVNESYIFFKPLQSKVKGAGHVPLTTEHSIAVDPKYIPLGSVVLATVPIIDKDRKFSHHELRFLVAQDIGGAIKGSGHVDLYCGIGNQAKHRASNLHQYGNLWVLLPKAKENQDDRLISQIIE